MLVQTAFTSTSESEPSHVADDTDLKVVNFGVSEGDDDGTSVGAGGGGGVDTGGQYALCD